MRAIVLCSSAVLPFLVTAPAAAMHDRPPVTAIEAAESRDGSSAEAGGSTAQANDLTFADAGTVREEPFRLSAGPDVLWENGLSWLNGLSNITEPRRSILDDFVVDGAGWSIVGWHAKVGRNCGVFGCGVVPWEYTVYADDNGAPDPDNIVAVAQSTSTESMIDPEHPDFFGLDVYDVWSAFDPIELPPGTYWIEVWNRSGDGGSFQAIGDYPQHRGASVWVDYEDFGGLRSGFEVFGDHYDVNFELLGTPLPGAVLPGGFDVVFGAYRSGEVDALYASDDMYVVIEQRSPVSVLLPRIRLEVDGTAAGETASSITVVVEAAANSLPTRPPQRLSLLDYDAGAWEQIDERTATFDDSVVEVTIDADPARFIEPGTRTMSLRADWFNPALVFSPAWAARVDQARWTVTP